MPDEEIPEPVYLLCARARARQLGNNTSEQQIVDVARRPWFRATVKAAYQSGWMDALIYVEEERGRKRRRTDEG